MVHNACNRLIAAGDVAAIFAAHGAPHLAPRRLELYRQATVHRSYLVRKNSNFETGNADCPAGCVPLQEQSGERHEYLGDAILNAVVAHYVYRRYPHNDEGFLTNMRSRLVNGRMLASLSRRLGLDRFLLISQQVESAKGRSSAPALEDVFEAFLGAVFLDLGYEAADAFVTGVLEKYVDFADLVKSGSNAKEALVKRFRSQYNALPSYEPQQPAAAPDKQDRARVWLCVRDPHSGAVLGTGCGATRKDAEHEAARCALQSLKPLVEPAAACRRR